MRWHTGVREIITAPQRLAVDRVHLQLPATAFLPDGNRSLHAIRQEQIAVYRL
jgi:hypothetical protein